MERWAKRKTTSVFHNKIYSNLHATLELKTMHKSAEMLPNVIS